MADFKLSVAARNAAANALADRIDGGTGAGTIAIRDSTSGAPAATTGASAGTLLGTLTFATTAFGAASSGTVTANSITSDTNADDSGDANYFRVYRGSTADGAADWQGTCSTAAGDDMAFDNDIIVAGGTIAISSFTLTMPTSAA